MTSVNFFVPGIPKPGGSKTAFRSKRGKMIVTDSCKGVKPWRAAVAQLARDNDVTMIPRGIPVSLLLVFTIPRPKGHYGTGKNANKLKPGAPPFPTGRPDVLKLARAVEDALTGILWYDDAQIVKESLQKLYCVVATEMPGVYITAGSLA